MARLRQSKKHQAFEKKYDRASARIIKQMHLQQSNASPSPSPPIKSTPAIPEPKPSDPEERRSHIITAQDIESLPTSFGKKKTAHTNHNSTNNKTKVNFSEEFESDDTTNNNNNTNGTTQSKEDTSKYIEHIVSSYQIPMKYVAKLKGHIKLWDFGGMNQNLESFRTITPFDGHPVTSLDYNYSGSMFVCCTTAHGAKVYNRDGRQLIEFCCGDMYIRDMNHTFGHTMPLNGGKWFGANALRQNVSDIATWSQDSTFRIWDTQNNTNGHCKQIIKARNKTGKRIAITAADFSKTNSLNSFVIAIGCNDGSIQLFDHKSHCKRPKKIISSAHLNGSDISHVMFDRIDGNKFVSRGGMNDNTMKLWDIRALSQAVKVFDNMWNITSLANVIQHDALYITMCSNSGDSKSGKSVLCFIDRNTLDEVIRIPISNKAINSVLWHDKINQVFVGGNDSVVRVYYEDEPISRHGVLLCAKRKYKKKHIDEQIKYFKIINPNALRSYKKQSQIAQEKRKKDLLAHKPVMPHYGIGVGGRINTESFTANVYKSHEKNVMSQVDPRDRLLLFNEKAKQDQQFTQIYNINQPKPVFQHKNQQELEANNIVAKLYSDMPGARQYNSLDPLKQPPKKKQKT
eukprot:299280_1